MSQLKDTVVVIKSINFKEADKILTVFGKNFGRYAIIAKGIRKIESRNRGNLQTMSVANISFYRGTGMGVLTDSDLIAFPDVSYEVMKNIERILVLINRVITEEQPDKDIFVELLKVIKYNFEVEYVNRFRLFFLKKMGFLDYALCAGCGESSKEMAKFAPESFEFYCPNCYKKVSRKLIDVKAAKENPSVLSAVLDDFVGNILE